MDVRKGIINTITDSTKLQTVQVEGVEGELIDGVERYQAYGFSSNPMPVDDDGRGAEVILAGAGATDLTSVIATDDRRYRPTDLEAGDVVIYAKTDKENGEHRIHLPGDGSSILIKCGQSSIELLSDGTIKLTGNSVIIDTDSLIHNSKNVGDTHTHGGVQGGSGSTSAPN